MTSHPFDAITARTLRDAGSMKWTQLPGGYGAGVAEMDFGTAPAVREAITAAANGGMLGYLPPWAGRDLAEACAAWYREHYGWGPDPRWVWPITDGLTGLQLAIEHFTQPGSAVIVPTPAYMPFLTVPRWLGREVIEIPMHGNALDLAAISQAFGAGAGLLILCNPHNPTGLVATRAELQELSQVVSDAAGRVLADEIWAPLCYGGAEHIPYASVSSQAAEHTLTVTSAAKAWNLPGAKCAQFIASNPADAARFESHHLGHLRPAATLGALANTAAYQHGEAWLTDVMTYLQGNREVVAEELAGTGITMSPPEATYLAWLDCRSLGVPVAQVARESAGVFVVDGIECGQAGRGFIRFNFAMPRPVLRQTLAALRTALAS